jgi:hypothetical protein
MKKKRTLNVTVSLIVILLYSVQLSRAEFKLFSFLQSKKTISYHENCKFHIYNLYLPSIPDSLEHIPVLKADIICDVDIDGDGIPNRLDDCPAIPGLIALQGCPHIDNTKSITYGNPTVKLKAEDFDMLVEIFSNLEFEGAQQSLSKKSQTKLDGLVKFLKREKRLFLYISAYVNVGSNRMQNYYMSESRVLSLGNYLRKKGVASHRIETMFFGDMMHVVSLPATRFEVEICDKKKP